MKKYIIACICIFLFADLYPQDNFGDLKAEWQKKNFSAAQVKRLVDYHKKNPAKRTPELDYLIATSYCALKDPKGCETWFPKLLQYSSLDANTRNFIKRVQGENCPIGKSVSLVELEGAGRSRRTASVSGRLKEYSSTGLNPSMVSRPTLPVIEISDSVVSQRRFGHNDSIVLQKLYSLYPGMKSHYRSKNFLVVNHGKHTQIMSQTILARLEEALDFFTREYGLGAPGYLITVHIIPPELTSQLSKSLYGIKLPYGAIGYSWTEDGSIFGVIRDNSTATGTLKHELFHIVANNGFPDMPVWLEEGLASLYEESTFTNGRLTGNPGWRGNILREEWSFRPDLTKLLTMYPDEFDGFCTPESVDAQHFMDIKDAVQAANYAMARYLMIYLQQMGKLPDIYSDCRNIDFENLTTAPGRVYIDIFERTIDKPAANIDADFVKWFRAIK